MNIYTIAISERQRSFIARAMKEMSVDGCPEEEIDEIVLLENMLADLPKVHAEHMEAFGKNKADHMVHGFTL